MATAAVRSTADRAVMARSCVAAVALAWAFLFFGVIDFLVAVFPSSFPEFLPFVALETSWGLLYAVLLPVPLIAWAIRPVGWVGPQVVGIAAAVLVAGVAAGAWGQVFVALLVAAPAVIPRMWRPWPTWSLRRALTEPAWWPAGALVALALVAGLVHAWHVVDLARSGAADDETWYLMHLPMHAGFALAVPVSAAVAVLAAANRVRGSRWAIAPPAGCAIWFGVVSARYPDHVGSLGELPGFLAIGWGIALAAAVWLAGARVTSRQASAPGRSARSPGAGGPGDPHG